MVSEAPSLGDKEAPLRWGGWAEEAEGTGAKPWRAGPAGRPVRLPMYQLLHQLGVLPRLLGMGTGSQLLPKQHSKIRLPSSSMHLFGKDFSEATSVKRPLLQNWDLELKFTL